MPEHLGRSGGRGERGPIGFRGARTSLGPVEQAVLGQQQHLSRVRVNAPDNHFLKRAKAVILAHKRLSVVAATMVTVLAAGLIVYVSLFSPSTAAYALEQTAQANDHVTSYHVKIAPPSSMAGVGEAWVQLAPDGSPLHARMDIFGGDRGDRVGIVSKTRAEFWWKANNIRVVSDNQRWIDLALQQCKNMRVLFDPKLAFEQLRADEEAGKVQVATKEPARQGEPITLTVTSKGEPNRRHVYEVDPQSKLVERVIEYRGCGGRWRQVWECDYLDYNKEIDPKVFQPELPKEITTIDPAKMDLGKLGLAHGELTDDQVATKLAKEYFEALIGGEYQKLIQLNDVRTATWKRTYVVQGPGQEAETGTDIVMFLTPSHERTEKTVCGRKEIEIRDGQKSQAISLLPAAKLALVLEFKNQSALALSGTTYLNLRRSIANARSGTGGPWERLGVETIDGRRAEGFRIRRGTSRQTIWADPKTSLPVRVEGFSLVGRDEVRTVMTDFHINVDLDESLFRLDVPAGYAVQTMERDLSRPLTAYLVDTLKFAAEHNGDVFPPALLGEQGLPDILRRALAALEKKYGKDSPQMFKLESEMTVNRALAFEFLSNVAPTRDGHYAGKDVKLYTPGVPIFWYKPTGADKYRVVFADLKVKDLALEAFRIPFGPPAKPLGGDRFEVTFSYRPSKKAQSVYLAGSFNRWNPAAHKMDGPDPQGRFSTRLKLKKGTYEYKFVLDGQNWETDPGNIWQSGFNGNSEVHVGILSGPPAKPLGDDQFEVPFSYRPGRKAQAVYLAGSFNNWNPAAHKMDGPDHEGRFSTRLKLKKGTYEYKFVLDGQNWETDPNNVWQTGPYQNSLLHVGVCP